MNWKTTVTWRYLFLNGSFVDIIADTKKCLFLPTKVFLMIIIIVELSKVLWYSKNLVSPILRTPIRPLFPKIEEKTRSNAYKATHSSNCVALYTSPPVRINNAAFYSSSDFLSWINFDFLITAEGKTKLPPRLLNTQKIPCGTSNTW